MQEHMASDRIQAALDRIERALDRIEQAPPQPATAAPRREQAAQALRSLDSLISELKTAQERAGHG